MKLFMTYCSWQKDDRFKNNTKKVGPEILYTSRRIRSFIAKCTSEGVVWAILSDHYGIWFPHEKHRWYDLHPDLLSNDQLQKLVLSFKSLSEYDEIWFFYDAETCHPLYRKVVRESDIEKQVKWFNDLQDISCK